MVCLGTHWIECSLWEKVIKDMNGKQHTDFKRTWRGKSMDYDCRENYMKGSHPDGSRPLIAVLIVLP
jgi:hypothetical protein